VSLCPGRHLANAEILQFVFAVLARFDLVAAQPAVPPAERTRAERGGEPYAASRSSTCRSRRSAARVFDEAPRLVSAKAPTRSEGHHITRAE